ncbi:retrotransposon protein, putative, ty1-copia subclass [Tanacetum coccineum]
MEWYRNLRIVLSVEDKLPFPEQPIPAMPVPPAGQNLKHLGAYDMLKELKRLYAQQTDQELLQTVREFHARKQEEGQETNQKKKSHKAAKGNQGKGKAKMGYALVLASPFAPKPKNPPTPKKDNPAKDAICHQCGEVGHWRRNCPVYLAELMKKKKLSQRASTSCSRLYKDGFVNRFENDNSISVSRNNLIYFNAIPRDDIYEILLSSSNINDSSMYVVSNKRAKLNLDSALLWHCRLGHISKKALRSCNIMDLSIQLTSSLLKSVFPVCLERWQENLIHIKWKGHNYEV